MIRYVAERFDVVEQVGSERTVVFHGCDAESAQVVAAALNALVARRRRLSKLVA